MANIATYRPTEPWAGTNPLEASIDDLMRGFFVRPLSLETRGWGQTVPLRVEVSENETAYRVAAEIPGVRKDDISVSINGPEVTISAEVKNENEVKEGERILRSERYYGKVQRTLALGFPIDESRAEARYTDGVLELVLPKSEAAMPKRVAVH
jgi:HSP20 family protein